MAKKCGCKCKNIGGEITKKKQKHKRYIRHHRCEYYGCRKIARYPLRAKDGSVIAWYCKEHYNKVIHDFTDLHRKIRKKIAL